MQLTKIYFAYNSHFSTAPIKIQNKKLEIDIKMHTQVKQNSNQCERSRTIGHTICILNVSDASHFVGQATNCLQFNQRYVRHASGRVVSLPCLQLPHVYKTADGTETEVESSAWFCASFSASSSDSESTFAFTFADCRAVDLCFHLDIGPGRRVGVCTCGRIDTGSLFAAKFPDKNVCYVDCPHRLADLSH